MYGHVDTPLAHPAPETGILADRQDGRCWDELVAEGRELAAAANGQQWRIGDLALEVAEMRPHGGVPADVETRLNRFSNEIGVPFNTLRDYRRVAARWPEDTRVSSVSFFVHRAFAGLDDRFDLILLRRWTMRSALEHVAGRPSPHASKDVDVDRLLGHRDTCPLCGSHRSSWGRLLRRRKRT
jgi:hypothetical protein